MHNGFFRRVTRESAGSLLLMYDSNYLDNKITLNHTSAFPPDGSRSNG